MRQKSKDTASILASRLGLVQNLPFGRAGHRRGVAGASLYLVGVMCALFASRAGDAPELLKVPCPPPPTRVTLAAVPLRLGHRCGSEPCVYQGSTREPWHTERPMPRTTPWNSSGLRGESGGGRTLVLGGAATRGTPLPNPAAHRRRHHAGARGGLGAQAHMCGYRVEERRALPPHAVSAGQRPPGVPRESPRFRPMPLPARVRPTDTGPDVGAPSPELDTTSSPFWGSGRKHRSRTRAALRGGHGECGFEWQVVRRILSSTWTHASPGTSQGRLS